MEVQRVPVPVRLAQSIVRLAESLLLLMAVMKEDYSRHILRYYESELYETLRFVRRCSLQKRNLYVRLVPGSESKTALAALKKDIERMDAIMKRLQKELGDGGKRRRRRRR